MDITTGNWVLKIEIKALTKCSYKYTAPGYCFTAEAMCKLTMAPLWLGFLSTALHALLVSSSPTSIRNTDLQSSPCVSFKLGSASIEQLYNMTYSPNPLFPSYLPTVDRALVEAKLIFPLATASNCSKHIGEFLLYAYLPQCFVFQTTIILVFPCVDFCQRIRSCCASGLLASNGITWPQWLDCDNIGAAISNYQNVCYSPPSYADDQNCPQPTGTASAATSASATMTAPTATSSSAGTTASQSLPPTVAPTTSSQPINPSGVPGCSYFRFSPWSEQYYDTTYAPNPLSPAYLPTVESALREARLIFPSALASNCSSHIGEFLLYAYFPQCYFSPPNTYGVVLPCQDFCVAIQSCCSSVLATYGIQWPEWLSCGKIGAAISSSSNPNICFRPPLNETDSKCLPVAATTQPTTSRATMSRPATTSPPSPPPCYCNSTCNSCNIRTNVTSATFTVANFDYSFGKGMHAGVRGCACVRALVYYGPIHNH